MSEVNENVQKQMSDPDVQAKLARVKAILGGAKTQPEPQQQEVEIEEVVAKDVAVAGAKASGLKPDWSKFNLDPSIAHLYAQSEIYKGQIVVLLDEFEFVSDSWRKLGPTVSSLVNGPDRWNIATVLPNGAGMGAVMLRKQTPMLLPFPQPLETEAQMPDLPTDPELDVVEQDAIAWMKEQGLEINEGDEVLPAFVAAGQAAAEALAGEDFGTVDQVERTETEIEGA